MGDNSGALKFRPSGMSMADFIACFGGVYEHSPWVAELTWQRGLDAGHDSADGLAVALAQSVDGADRERCLQLIRAHPDLAGRAAVSGTLTAESTSEQSSAGIDQCSADEFSRFQRYNDAYKNKFEFPFVIAVRGSNRDAILAAFQERLENDYDTEFRRAISEIHKIAKFRLQAIVDRSNGVGVS